MARFVTFEVPVDTSMFTPLQLQSRTALGFAMSGWARWLREHWVPFPRLIRDLKLGVVIASLDLEYLRPFEFFAADAVVVTATLRVRSGGGLLYLTISVVPSGGRDEVARVEAVLRPVKIADGVILSATPTDLSDEILGTFTPDEIIATGSGRRLPAVVAELEAGSALVAVESRPFTLHRHLCETADQWSGVALCDLATEVREQLVAGAGNRVPAVASGVVEPMRRMTLEFRQAAFFLDEFVVECRAYARHNEVVFLHHIADVEGGKPLAVFAEWFPAVAGTADELIRDMEQGVLT